MKQSGYFFRTRRRFNACRHSSNCKNYGNCKNCENCKKRRVPGFSLLIASFFLLLSLTQCQAVFQAFFGSGDIIAGRSLPEIMLKGGVVQASPGIEETPVSNGAFVVPPDKSLLRFKVYDDPIPNGNTHGLVHFVLEYISPSALIQDKATPAPDLIRLYVEKITVKKRDFQPGEKQTITLTPSLRDREVVVKRHRHYIPLVKNLSLPAGHYKDLRVHFKKTGQVVINGELRTLEIKTEDVFFNQEFQAKAGKITTLHGIPPRESSLITQQRTGASDPGWAKTPYLSLAHPDRSYSGTGKTKYPAHIKVKAFGSSVSDPVEKIFIEMLKIEAVDSRGARFLLNNTRTVFELLGLRNGSVALLGHNMVPAGSYAYFEMTIGTNHTIHVGGGAAPLVIEYQTQNVLRFEGPYDLRGGRITELFLHFDPNSSVFYTKTYGYILDPSILVASVTSFTSAQDLRLREALGAVSNIVCGEANVIFQGGVTEQSVSPGKNIYNQFTIYTHNRMKVEDRIRGAVENPDDFPLRVPGGEYGGLRLRVRGMPEFRYGESFLLFLKRENGKYRIVRGAYGKVSL